MTHLIELTTRDGKELNVWIDESAINSCIKEMERTPGCTCLHTSIEAKIVCEVKKDIKE